MFLREKAILHLHRRGIRLIEQEIGVTEMNLTEKEFVKFLSKFDEHPFDVKIGDEVSHIGKGESEFTVIFHSVDERTINEYINCAWRSLHGWKA